MEKTLIKHSGNAMEFPKNYEKNRQASLTVPNQAISMSLLMEKYARGLPLDGQRLPVYDEDQEFIPDLQKLDLAEREQLLHQVKSQINEIRQKANQDARLKQAQKAQKEAQQDDQTSQTDRNTVSDIKPLETP